MKFPINKWLLFAVLSVVISFPFWGKESVQKITVVDDVNRAIMLEKPLSRVVVFNQMNCEIIRALGKENTIVGADANILQPSNRSYWPNIDPNAVVGKSQTSLDYERIVKMMPEAVIIPKNGSYEEAIKNLDPFGIKVIVVTAWVNTEYEKQINILAKAYDAQKRGDELISFCKKQLKMINDRLKNTKKKTVYLENSGEYKTCLAGSGWNDMILSAGGTNIFGDIIFENEDSSKGSVHSFQIDPESILVKNPDAILYLVYSTKANSGTGIYTEVEASEMLSAVSELKKRTGWENLGAVKKRQVFGLTSFAGNSCFKIVGTCYLAKWLYPDLFKDLDADAFFSEWLNKFQGMKPLKNHAIQLK
jgi:iron complex transport system substrate-binding protein